MVPDMRVHPDRGVDSYPLSPMQQGMLFHRLNAVSPGVDLEQVVGELREAIEPAEFERAWREVIARHAILRTSFHLEQGGDPRQVVHPASAVRLDFQYLEFGSESEARRGLEEYLADDRREGFGDLAGPLLRVALLRGGPEHHWFVSTFHHLLLDGRGMGVMFREVLDLHDGLVRGAPLELPPPRPYRDYIDWLQTLDLDRAENFWRGYLRGLAAPTELPLARPAGDALGDVAPRGELGFRLTDAMNEALHAAARRHEVTMNTLMQAAWGLVLSRYTGEEEVVFGAVRACRHIPVEGAGTMVGLLINTVPVRLRVDPDAAIGPWLKALREHWVAFREYEHTPLMKIQQWSEVPPGRPLFEALFNYQEPSWESALSQLGGKWARRSFETRSEPNYPLAIDAYGGASTIVKLLYDRRRFTGAAMARLLGNFRVALEAFAGAGADLPVRALPVLSPRERQQLLARGRGRMTDFPRTACVHTLVESCASRMPDRVAISDPTLTLTYAELNRAADALARRLRDSSVGAETLVAVCMERSVEMVVAWLAVWKAGGAFVPLDPHYPPERLAFQLGDSAAPVVLTQRRLLPRLPASTAMTIAFDAADCRAAAQEVPATDQPRRRSGRPPAPENLAYIIYTSGSTGQPKGVQIEHRSVMNLIGWHQREFGVTAGDRATHLASPAFDASIWEIWPYLACGASVHLPDEETRIAPAQLWRWLARQQITIAFLPTPVLEAAMNEPWPDAMALRALLTGGDQLKRRPPANFPCRLINNYGPTENTVVSTAGLVESRDDAQAPSIGRPIDNTYVHILDRELRLVPEGVPGELHVGGENLARGYLNRPALDAEKFVPDPLAGSGAPAAGRVPRLYRTGDLVRWTERGEIEYLGRIDGQVKIRGCRIELGEIEAALHAHPAVREALVLACPDGRGEPQLVGYVIPAASDSESADEPVENRLPGGNAGALAAALGEWLRAKLPGYMVPAAVVPLPGWPLTPNGKIDRRVLPRPESGAGAGRKMHAPPVGATEETIARIFSEILGRSPIGRDDNFFELGGHSLQAAQAVTRLNRALQATLSVRTLFDQPTTAMLADELGRRGAGSTGARSLPRMKRRLAAPETKILQPN